MTKTLIKISFIALLMSPFLCSYASAKKPVEAFIDRVRQTNTFVEVSNIWQPDNNSDKAEVLKHVKEAALLTIDFNNVTAFLKKNPFAMNLTIPSVNGGYYTIELARYNILANDFEVWERGASSEKRYDYTPGHYYSGIVKGVAGSLATFSFFNNEVFGIFSIPGEGNYVIEANTIFNTSRSYNTNYILYNDRHVKAKQRGCAADMLPERHGLNGAHKPTTYFNNSVYNSCREIRVMEVADYDLYTQESSSTANVINYLTALFNSEAAIYRNEGIPIVLKYTQVNTAPDEYMALPPGDILRSLKMFGGVTQNALHGCDLAVLTTTRIVGYYAGMAWLFAMCSAYSAPDSVGPYGIADMVALSYPLPAFPTFFQNIYILSHEMGHILGSPHTHQCCWNPPGTGTTAIDGCTSIDGSCASPGLPAGGGTIMSYCQQASVGVNFAYGFGQQPGDTIRSFIRSKFAGSSSCGGGWIPQTPLSAPGSNIAANRECTDISLSGDATTYYWYDNNTADHGDDTLVLAIKKHGNNIGTLDSATFSVRAVTLPGYGAGSGQTVAFPAGVPGTSTTASKNRTFNRYWEIKATTEPVTPVDVLYPYTAKDSSDVDGSVTTTLTTSSFKMYRVDSPVDPDPSHAFPGATASAFTVYTYSTTPTTTKWTPATIGTAKAAQMKMTRLSGGGTGFHSTAPTGVFSTGRDAPVLQIFPNPTGNVWNVELFGANVDETIQFNLYAADGRTVKSLLLKNGINEVSAHDLANGIYFYRVVTTIQTYTGNLQKN